MSGTWCAGRVRVVLGGAMFVLAACGGPSEAEQIALLATEVDTQVDYLDQGEAECVASSLFTADPDTEMLTGPELVADVEDGSADLLAFVDSDEGVAAVDGCVEMEDRFGGYLSSEFDETLTPDCVATTSFDDEPLRSALLQDLDEAATWAGDDELRPQLLDAARGCVSEITFAAMAGLDDPRELASVMITDPFAKYDDVRYQDDCVVEAVVTAVGIERLAELEITVDEPGFADRLGDLESFEHEEITVELRQCQPRQLVERLVENAVPQLVECVSGGLDENEVDEIVERAVAGRTVVRQDPLRALFDTCTDEAVERLFGLVPERSSDVRYWVYDVSGAASDLVELSQFESECLLAGYLSVTDDDTLLAIDPYLSAVYEERLPSQSAALAFIEVMSDYSDIAPQCLTPWTRIEGELSFAEISEASYPCIELSMDPDSITYGYELEFEGLWEGSPTALNRLEDMLTELGEHIDDCGTGADRAKWADYMGLIFDPEFEAIEDPEVAQTT